MFISAILAAGRGKILIARLVRDCLSSEAAIPYCRTGSKTAAVPTAAGIYTESGNDAQRIYKKTDDSGFGGYRRRLVDFKRENSAQVFMGG